MKSRRRRRPRTAAAAVTAAPTDPVQLSCATLARWLRVTQTTAAGWTVRCTCGAGWIVNKPDAAAAGQYVHWEMLGHVQAHQRPQYGGPR